MLRKCTFYDSYQEPSCFVVPEYQYSTNEVVDYINPKTGESIKHTVVKQHPFSVSDYCDVSDSASNYSVQVLQSANIPLAVCPTYEHLNVDDISDSLSVLDSEVLDINNNNNNNNNEN